MRFNSRYLVLALFELVLIFVGFFAIERTSSLPLATFCWLLPLAFPMALRTPWLMLMCVVLQVSPILMLYTVGNPHGDEAWWFILFFGSFAWLIGVVYLVLFLGSLMWVVLAVRRWQRDKRN